jgi:death-on-curing protein
MDPEFLRIDDVLQIHRDEIERYGGSPDLRDPGLLTSAVAMPLATFDGARLHADVFDIAAAYLFHIVQNHPGPRRHWSFWI